MKQKFAILALLVVLISGACWLIFKPINVDNKTSEKRGVKVNVLKFNIKE
jgi:hypothetical protein